MLCPATPEDHCRPRPLTQSPAPWQEPRDITVQRQKSRAQRRAVAGEGSGLRARARALEGVVGSSTKRPSSNRKENEQSQER